MVIQTWGFSRHFLENEQSEPANSRETTDLLFLYKLPMINLLLFPMIKFELSSENVRILENLYLPQ